jgi:hypothetical protein
MGGVTQEKCATLAETIGNPMVDIVVRTSSPIDVDAHP